MFGGWEEERVTALLELLNHHDAEALQLKRSLAEELMERQEEGWNTLLEQRGKLLQEGEYLEGALRGGFRYSATGRAESSLADRG